MLLMNYLQGSNGDADIKNTLVDTGGEEEGGMDGESNMETMCFHDRISKWTSCEGIDLPKATEPSSS